MFTGDQWKTVDFVQQCPTFVTMKTETLSIRVESDLIARMQQFEASTGVEKATLLRAAVSAVLAFYEANGFISFPIEVVPTAGKGR